MFRYAVSSRGFVSLLLSFVVLACDDVVTVEAPGNEPFGNGDAVLGRAAFSANCANCHASRDGFDLAHFSFDAHTIVRRATAHVDTATAVDIVAHIRTMESGTADPTSRPFQPGGEVLSGDLEFATRLFGSDAWPTELSAQDLRAFDPRDVEVALAFPRWSVEANNLDWMPEQPVNDPILDWNDGYARRWLDDFYRTNSVQDLINAVQGMRIADRAAASSTAPCIITPIESLRPSACFETRRWAATLGAQYMLRHDIATPIHSAIHDAWWDVGFVARQTVLRDGHFEHGDENWAVWMWLGWVFEPDRHASVYLAQGLDRLGLNRHAAFHALRAQVSRPANSLAVFQDTRTAARFAPEAWMYNVVSFAFTHAMDRLDAGELPMDTSRAANEIRGAYTAASPALTTPQQAALLQLRDEVLKRLPPQS